ncbi:hypothetical protein LTR10_018674 [Elasticomyces elasticus]|uniref:SMP-LTD domain-containing protein n=1 Tax=Exophiala sideris TaxID=1016849 RepID=A0ABR0JS55_9EURO|nr:hypothetical protein LTR10_018674 [Elasticomyces elasticus]KAK5040421.1 hypothetical protein LTS07_000919 [Exophiala sideris]KAK5043153.1 hypothetical protein LTR13_000924 [Exophiala sideris]KAK5068799.1 hypothetical protein LTR69_000920 [Exophiala sideris]KAK5186396.1 hypothetical protein LTR44_001452 [Eurotiomycetes sp. CCFEE 6388]
MIRWYSLLLLHAYYTLPPPRNDGQKTGRDPANLLRTDDDKLAFRTTTDDLAEKFHRKHDSDVASGYFAVCREYVPGGVNGKPPEKLTPAGDVVSQESPSVYQSMYRSIFDRSQKPTIEPNKDGNGKAVKRANNVFYVVLRHGHLMLYDDIQQLEVRYVISLEYHDVDVYGGDEDIPEGELWIKRNSIRLSRKKTRAGDTSNSPPFFFFGENQSEKEDFYYALLQNQDKIVTEDLPVTQEFDMNHIVTLVQKLHSSEEFLQTRWLNAMIGRLFLAMYKTPELEGFIRNKLTKKISRVKKPTFITKLALRKIDTGTGAPFVTNPRLKDLTVNGDCTVEADVNYAGNFRIEIAATARIDLGTRFKAREVDMVLAVTLRRIQGHILFRFKPPPSNRIWFSFERLPHLDFQLEPIVSSRQITYTFILRAIENRIREVVAESICLPFWDDIPFFDTSGQRYRGGIWQRDPDSTTSTEIPDEMPEDEAEAGASEDRTPVELSRDERVMSMPVLPDSKPSSKINAAKKSVSSLNEFLGMKSSENVDKSEGLPPRLMRSTSFASAADPTVTADNADVGSPTRDLNAGVKKDSVATLLKDLSARVTSDNQSPVGSQAGSPPVESAMARAMRDRERSSSSTSLAEEIHATKNDSETTLSASLPEATSSRASIVSNETEDVKENDEKPARQRSKNTKSFAARSLNKEDRKQAIASINAAAAAAQKWGWGVLARNKQRDGQSAAERDDASTPREPMGRGRPLPPPGTPLPPPEKPIRNNSFMAPKRKPVPPPRLPQRTETNGSTNPQSPRKVPKPPLPERRKRQTSAQPESQSEDEVLVVEAPTDSAPASPAAGEHHDEFFGHMEPPAAEKPVTSMSEEHPAAGSEEPTTTIPEQRARTVAEGLETEEPALAPEEHITTSPQKPPKPTFPAQPSEIAEHLPNNKEELSRQEMGMYTYES